MSAWTGQLVLVGWRAALPTAATLGGRDEEWEAADSASAAERSARA